MGDYQIYMRFISDLYAASRADIHSTYIYIFTNVGSERVRSNVNSPLHNGNNILFADVTRVSPAR